MPRGLPDYYNPDTLVAQRLVNINDLVTGLVGVNSIDGLGTLQWYDTFGAGITAWRATGAGDGAAPVSSTTRAFIPPASAKLLAGTLGGGGQSQMEHEFMLEDVAKVGLETALWYQSNAPEYRFRFRYDNPGDPREMVLAITPTSGEVEIFTPTGVPTIYSIPAAPAVGLWLNVKMVGDFDLLTYERLIIGQDRLDLTSYELDQPLPRIDGHATIQFNGVIVDAVSRTGYVGYVLLTMDEP